MLTSKGGHAKDTHTFYRGEKFRVEFYFNANGKMPSKEQIEKLPSLIKVKLAALVKLIAEEGQIYDEHKFRIVARKERIYEFKPMKYRFFNFFFDGGKIIITNGYRKKSQKVDKRELRKAIRMKRDYINRMKKGEYYG